MSLCLVEGRRTGLYFSSEDSSGTAESLMFVIPIPSTPSDNFHYYNLSRYLREEQFYFPALHRDQVIEVKSEIEFPTIRFRVPGTDEYIVFLIDVFEYDRIPFSVRPNEHVYLLDFLSYAGTHKRITREGQLYAALIPDVAAMDHAYAEHGFALVGLTPQFGIYRE